MNNQPLSRAPKSTAVLVVHGMGSQRPLDTMRGVVDAVWLEGDRSYKTRRTWLHPELSGVDDLDLSVITTSIVPGTDRRRIDFHELYWAHLMSETRAVAVLLWLLELARMGPRLKPSIAAVYWGALVFLSALVLSVSLLAIQIITQFAQLVATHTNVQYSFVDDFHSFVSVFLVSIVVTATFGFLAATWKRAFKLAVWSFGLAATAALLFFLVGANEIAVAQWTKLLLPIVVAAVVIKVTMGWWGIAGLGIVLLLSFGAWGVGVLPKGQIPWSITSFWSSIAACYFIALYLALYATFLQPYLGDAARYFRNSPANVSVRRKIRRQAVSTLKALHASGDYDRIIIVAHSLGTVVAYDMLRQYYSRLKEKLPDPNFLAKHFEGVDHGTLEKSAAREKGRQIIAYMAQAVEDARQRIATGNPKPGDEKLRAWVVTDFVTLGSPLTHAKYLMCHGKTKKELCEDFDRRTREREFPTCPPRMIDDDLRLTFVNPKDGVRYFHHGGQFALTRWTNLYFPNSQLLWGDAIGGEVGSVFGDRSGSNIADVPVFTSMSKRHEFFAHVLYWDMKHGKDAPHIEALRKAIDLADTGLANSLR